MPVLPVSPYNVATDITALVRTLCNDQQGQFYTDTYLLQAVNSAYRWMMLEMMNVGKQTFTNDGWIATIPAVTVEDPGLQCWISFTGVGGNLAAANSPYLPNGLVEPLELFERPTGSTDLFVPMQNLTAHGGLPSVPQVDCLRYWEWRTDRINFVGATQSTDIRIRWEGTFSIFTIVNGAMAGTCQVLSAIDAVAYQAAAIILKPRGSPLAADYATGAVAFIDLLKNQETRAQQHTVFRRRGFSSRYGVGRTGY